MIAPPGRSLPIVLAAATLVGFFIIMAEFASRWLDFPVELMWQDPASTMGGAFYTGALSHAGVLAWWTAAVSGLLAWRATRRHPVLRRRGNLLGAFGVLSAALALDDLFMVHEYVAPVHFGVPELVILGTWAGALLLILVRYRDILLSTIDSTLLLAAGLALGVMAAVDLSLPDSPLQVVLEEGSKLLGVLLWASLNLRAAVRTVAPATFGEAAGYA